MKCKVCGRLCFGGEGWACQECVEEFERQMGEVTEAWEAVKAELVRRMRLIIEWVEEFMDSLPEGILEEGNHEPR